MKKALVIGGSSGIGLAIAKNLIGKGYHVDILSRREPEKGILPEGKYDHHYCDMLDLAFSFNDHRGHRARRGFRVFPHSRDRPYYDGQCNIDDPYPAAVL